MESSRVEPQGFNGVREATRGTHKAHTRHTQGTRTNVQPYALNQAFSTARRKTKKYPGVEGESTPGHVGYGGEMTRQ